MSVTDAGYRTSLAEDLFPSWLVLSSELMCAKQTSTQMDLVSVARNATLGRDDG